MRVVVHEWDPQDGGPYHRGASMYSAFNDTWGKKPLARGDIVVFKGLKNQEKTQDHSRIMTVRRPELHPDLEERVFMRWHKGYGIYRVAWEIVPAGVSCLVVSDSFPVHNASFILDTPRSETVCSNYVFSTRLLIPEGRSCEIRSCPPVVDVLL